MPTKSVTLARKFEWTYFRISLSSELIVLFQVIVFSRTLVCHSSLINEEQAVQVEDERAVIATVRRDERVIGHHTRFQGNADSSFTRDTERRLSKSPEHLHL